MESRWTCGPLAGPYRWRDCDVEISLNYFRYVRQIQIAFHLGDEQHDEFSIEAKTAQGWMTVVASAISSGDTADYQTFDVGVHAVALKVVPKFQRVNQWFSVKEMVILETKNSGFIAGTLPVFAFHERNSENDPAPSNEVPTRFSFDIPDINEERTITMGLSTVTAFRMRFPADREFVFEFSYFKDSPSGGKDGVIERFTSAGGDNEWETFTLPEPATMGYSIEILAVNGPTFANVPDYPALRVVDFQVVGEAFDSPGYFRMVTAAMTEWGSIPDIIGDGVSDQQYIMTAICETKGATFDGTDCVGEIDDSTVYISLSRGDYYLDGPIFVKSGVTLRGSHNDDPPNEPFFYLYEGANNGNTAEDAMVVIDGVTDAELGEIQFRRVAKATGDIVPGTLGNLCLDVRNSKGLVLEYIWPEGFRNGAARFADSSNITIMDFFGSPISHTGNFMELTRVDGFYVTRFPGMDGLLMDTCNNIVWDGFNPGSDRAPSSRFSAPSGGNQTANVVITGDSSSIVFSSCRVGNGSEPRILMESTMPLTLDGIREYEGAESGDCIIGVPEGSADDLVVQVNVGDQTLSKSGDCWVLE